MLEYVEHTPKILCFDIGDFDVWEYYALRGCIEFGLQNLQNYGASLGCGIERTPRICVYVQLTIHSGCLWFW